LRAGRRACTWRTGVRAAPGLLPTSLLRIHACFCLALTFGATILRSQARLAPSHSPCASIVQAIFLRAGKFGSIW
jgi:hypothetical protein